MPSTIRWLDQLTRELRFAFRALKRSPVFAVVTILTLALGIGASTAAFSLVNGVLLQPLPYPDPERLVHLFNTAGAATVEQSDLEVLRFQEQAGAFDGLAAWRFDDGDLGAIEPDQPTARVRGARVTANFFDVIGVRPAMGRSFNPGEDRPGKNGVVVLSHRAWQEQLRGDPRALGRQIPVNDVPRTIVGIMPPGFAYPAAEVEIWLPLALDPANTQPATFNLTGIARLRPGVGMEEARADLLRVRASAGANEAQVAPQIESLRDAMVGPVSRLLWLVFGSVLVVLLVACTNVAGLFLVRAERAQRELAVRRALGSGLGGLLSLTLAESVLLSVAGGAAGAFLAAAAMKAAVAAATTLGLPRLEGVGPDRAFLFFAAAITLLCALLVSVLPVLRARRVSVAQVLRGAGSGGRPGQRARHTLIVAQMALALVLVASSGLMTRSFLRLSHVNPGFDADSVVTSRVLLAFARFGTADRRLAFFENMAERARAIPGTQDVALTDWVPLSVNHRDMALEVENDPAQSAGGASHPAASVDSGYFHTLRIPLLRGRTFGAQDPAHLSGEVVVSKTFAERYWRGDPLGKRLRPAGGPWYTVVGEVDDVHQESLDRPASSMVYFPIITGSGPNVVATTPGALSLVVRTAGRPGEVLAEIRRIVRSLHPTVPTYDEGTLDDLVTRSSARTRALAALLVVASIATSLLAAVGLYGIVAYIVSIRRGELGIRMALGARPADVRWMISLGGVRLAAAGIVIGTVATLALTRMMRGLLFGVSPTDPVTLAVTAVVLLIIGFIASWLPARRAAAVDPAETLRLQ